METIVVKYRMNTDQRNALRGAVVDHPGWKAISKKAGLQSSELTVPRLFTVAKALDLDAKAILADHGPLAGSKLINVPAELAALFEADLEAPAELAPAPAPAPEGEWAEFDRAVEEMHDMPGLDAAPAPAVPAPAPAPAGDKLAALESLLTLLTTQTIDRDAVKAIVTEATASIADRLSAIEAQERPKADVVVIREGEEMGRLTGLRHKQADELLKLASAALAYPGNGGLNIWLTGPAGSGKTFAVEQVCNALGLEFVFHGSMSMPHELLGFVDAGGTYHEPFFVDAYRNGKGVLLDEVDAGSNEALLTLNAALAGGKLALPNGEIVKRHPNFLCFGAANTFGGGATAEYVGRARIDAAFLDRFAIKLDWQYDADLERKLSGVDAWTDKVQAARKKAADAGIKVLITPRATEAGAALIAAGMSHEDAARFTYLAALTEEQRQMVS